MSLKYTLILRIKICFIEYYMHMYVGRSGNPFNVVSYVYQRAIS